MKTKTRRKMWVTFDGDDPVWVEGSAKMAKLQRLASESRPVPFIERRPGDVVLGREQSKRISEILDALHGSNMFIGPAVIELRALLRGGR